MIKQNIYKIDEIFCLSALPPLLSEQNEVDPNRVRLKSRVLFTSYAIASNRVRLKSRVLFPSFAIAPNGVRLKQVDPRQRKARSSQSREARYLKLGQVSPLLEARTIFRQLGKHALYRVAGYIPPPLRSSASAVPCISLFQFLLPISELPSFYQLPYDADMTLFYNAQRRLLMLHQYFFDYSFIHYYSPQPIPLDWYFLTSYPNYIMICHMTIIIASDILLLTTSNTNQLFASFTTIRNTIPQL